MTEIQCGKSVLRPRARLIKTIGEDLISNDVVAVIELVKNSYDADASIIIIKFSGKVEEVEINGTVRNVLKKEGSSISIYDDGSGMSLSTIQSAWMEPATIMKKGVKTSPVKARRYTGEKGIGRFASAKLSNNLKIVTRVPDDNEVVINFNWSDFADDEKYLDQVETTWEVREPIEFKNKGTILYLNSLNSDWDKEKFKALKVALSRLVNPVVPIEDFLIELNLPKDFEDYGGIILPPTSISKPDYYIKGAVSDAGIASFVYFSKGNRSLVPVSKDISRTLSPVRLPKSGAFSFELRAWNRDSDALDSLAKEVGGTVRNIRADLDQLNGVSIYRDNFRVLPYGEPKNDWLRLNARRVNNPTLRLSDNQLVGYIAIGLDSNPGLQDQSNREGIVESSAFQDLQEQIKSLLNELEIRRYEERPRRDIIQEPVQNIFANFSISHLASAVNERLPKDQDLIRLVNETQVVINKGVSRVQEVLSRYRRLSTLGQLVDTILHDGGHYLLNMDGDLKLLEKELKSSKRDESKINKHFDSLKQQRDFIVQLFKRVQPFSGRKAGRPVKIIIEQAIKNVFRLHENVLKEQRIEVNLPQTETTVKIDDGELQTILINLLQNSVYWLSTVSGYDRKIAVEIETEDDELSIIFSDNGPGIPESKAKFIFDPYYTTRPNGVGLGLTIVGELVAEYDGEFYLINNGPLGGATFKITFRKRV